MRVDLPAPFSPSKAWTSPLLTVRSTSSLATTPGNRFVIPFSSTFTGRGSAPFPSELPSLFGSDQLTGLAVDDLLLELLDVCLELVGITLSSNSWNGAIPTPSFSRVPT